MSTTRLLALLVLTGCCASKICAETALPLLPDATPPVATAVSNSVVIPALTPVSLEILSELGSKISKTGERFPIRLVAPITIDGKQLVAVGVLGEGEVIHAKKAGGGGSAGELVLAAQFLTIGDQQLKLRSMRIAVAGKDIIGTIDAINAASVVSPVPISLLGFGITGGNITIQRGTLAEAKTAEASSLAHAQTGLTKEGHEDAN